MKKNILITGGAGFIGSNLATKLVAKGYVVTIMDNLSEQIHGVEPEKTSPLYISIKEKVNFIRGDVRNKSDWQKVIPNQDVIIHLAAETGTGQSMYEIEKYVDVNIKGTAILLDILTNEKHSVKKILVASSRAIYGEGKYKCYEHGIIYPAGRVEPDMIAGDFEPRCSICNATAVVQPTDEESKIHPTSIYGITKQNQEQMVILAGKSIGVPAVALRYQNVYGPGQSLTNPYTGILSIFSTRIKNNNNITIFEDGLESRDFVYIDDVTDATILGIEKDEADFNIFNVGSGVPTTVLEVANTLKNKYNSNIEIIVGGNYRLGDIRHNYADLTKISTLLGFTPKYKFETGIANFVSWVNAQAVQEDKYEQSIVELKAKGLYK